MWNESKHLSVTRHLTIFKKLSMVLLCSSFFVSAEPLSVGWEMWYPYQFRNDKQELVGLDLDIFNAVMKQAKLQANYTELPWKRHLYYIRTGEMDLAMGASLTDDRKQYAHFTHPYRIETVRLFVKKGTAKKMLLGTLEDLIGSKYMIGVEDGYYYGKQYKQLIKRSEFQSHISEVLDIEQNVELAIKGHLDGFLVDPITLKVFIEKYKLHDEFEVHPVEIYSDSIHIMISKKSNYSNLLPKLNQAIDTLRQNGEINRIMARWSEL
jgi:polar amino acid transport system substrate-binding protein